MDTKERLKELRERFSEAEDIQAVGDISLEALSIAESLQTKLDENNTVLNLCLEELVKWRPLIQIITFLRNYGSITTESKKIYDIYDHVTGNRDSNNPDLLKQLSERFDSTSPAIEAATKALKTS